MRRWRWPAAALLLTMLALAGSIWAAESASPDEPAGLKTVVGHVQTRAGDPVFAVAVIAKRLDRNGREQTLTGPAGGYELHLGPGLWSLTVEHTPASDPAGWIYPAPPRLVHFDHDLAPEQKVVDFTVVTADSHVIGIVELPGGGAPTFTVTVGLRTSEGYGRWQAVGPGEGAFDLHVPHGQYSLVVHPLQPSYAGPPPAPVYAPPNETVDVGPLVLLDRDATIAGTVTDGQGNGVGEVRVLGWTRDHQGSRTATAGDGSYTLAVSAGEWLIRPVVPYTLPFVYAGQPATATVASGQSVTGVNFSLTAAANTVVGELVDGEGEPAAVTGWAWAAAEGRRVNGAPIAGGTFAIYLPDGDYQIGAHLSPGSRWLTGEAQAVSVAGGETVTLTFELVAQDATLHGALWAPREEVVPTGVPGHVWASNPWATAAGVINPANGAFHLGLAAGLWRLAYSVAPESNYVTLDHHLTIPLESGQTAFVPLPVAQRDATLQGIVLNPDGQPLAGALVAAEGLGAPIAQVTLRTLSGPNGYFRLDVPHGHYRLRAGAGDPAWLNPVLQNIVAPAGGTVSGITLLFREPDVALSGTTTIAGDPPVDGRVHLWAYSADGAGTHTSAALGELYTLALSSNSLWHVGAALETGDSFYALRTRIVMGAADESLDLVLGGPFPKPGPVVATFESDEPQQLALADGTSIFIPAGAMPVSGTVTLHITPIATLPHQHHARLYKYGYAFIAIDETGRVIDESFDEAVVVTFSYDEAELARLGLREGRLRPAYYSTTTQSWTVPDSYVVDPAANQVTIEIDHFTDFSLLDDGVAELFLPLLFR
jgi:hypothetical protein